MTDPTTTAKAQAEIPYGLIEYTVTFTQPIFEAWNNTARLTAVVLSALSPLGFKLEGVEHKVQVEKISERAIVFRRISPGAVFSVGLGRISVSAENLDWSEAEKFIAGISAAMAAVREVSRYEIESQQVVLGMHVQIKVKPQTEITAHLLNPVALKLLDGEVKTSGIILHREKSNILIDGSAAFANALYVRIVREHPANTSLPEVAARLHKDEEVLFDVLGITGVL